MTMARQSFNPRRNLNRHQMRATERDILRQASAAAGRKSASTGRPIRSFEIHKGARSFHEWLVENALRFKVLVHDKGSRYYHIRHVLRPDREAVIRFSDHRPRPNQHFLASVDGFNQSAAEAQILLIAWMAT